MIIVILHMILLIMTYNAHTITTTNYNVMILTFMMLINSEGPGRTS